MALTYFGVDDFQITGPPQWRPSLWDLDTLIVPYSGPVDALEGFLDGLTKGTAYGGDSAMFLVDFPIQNADKHYPAVDLIYMGKRGGVLPPEKANTSTAVQSATSKISSTGAVADNGITVQFNAPVSTISYISAGSPGGTSAADPTGDPEITRLMLGELPFSPSSSFVDDVIAGFFTIETDETTTSEEIVPGEYWKNTSTKTKFYSPFVFNFPPGGYAIVTSNGTNYVPGDVITIAGGGGSGTVTVTAIINTMVPGQIWQISQGSNTWVSNASGISGTGGSGTGAVFSIVIVT